MHKTVALLFALFAALCLVSAVAAQENGMDDEAGMEMTMQQAGGMCSSPGCVCGPGCGCPVCMAAKKGMGHGPGCMCGSCMAGGMGHGPGCMCGSCMAGGMGMKGQAGMMAGKMPGMMKGRAGWKAPGMRDDFMKMTWPPMSDSCRTPDFYLTLREVLGLDDDQVEKLRKMSVSLASQKILLGAKVKSLELELSEIVTTPGFKAGEALDKLSEIEKARTGLRTLVIKTSAEAQGALSKEQLGRLSGFGLPPAAGACSCMPGRMPAGGGGKDMPEMMQKMRREMMEKNMP